MNHKDKIAIEKIITELNVVADFYARNTFRRFYV